MNKNLRILVAEDSSFMQKLFVSNLKKIGYINISVAEDGNIAVLILKENTFDLIISDWNMPNRDGLSLLKWARDNDKYKSVPFLMATAQGDKAKVQEAFAAGANAHITKPFNHSQLNETIEIALGHIEKPKNIAREYKYTKNKVHMRISHIQITDHLILGVLKHQINNGAVKPKYFVLETNKEPGWNPIQNSLENGDIDGAFVLAPIAMDLFAFDIPIKLVSLAHKNGSIFVRNKSQESSSNDDMKRHFFNKVVNIPHKLSIHNVLAHKYLRQLGLKPGVPGGEEEINVTFEVVPPILMPRRIMGLPVL